MGVESTPGLSTGNVCSGLTSNQSSEQDCCSRRSFCDLISDKPTQTGSRPEDNLPVPSNQQLSLGFGPLCAHYVLLRALKWPYIYCFSRKTHYSAWMVLEVLCWCTWTALKHFTMRLLQLPHHSIPEGALSFILAGQDTPAEWHLFLNPWPLECEPFDLSVNTAGNQQTTLARCSSTALNEGYIYLLSVVCVSKCGRLWSPFSGEQLNSQIRIEKEIKQLNVSLKKIIIC